MSIGIDDVYIKAPPPFDHFHLNIFSKYVSEEAAGEGVVKKKVTINSHLHARTRACSSLLARILVEQLKPIQMCKIIQH